MEIKKSFFETSAVKPSQFPVNSFPQIALAGKSNIGKSSLINCLANNYKLARTSGQPGKTRLINFYNMNDSFYFVDLPGYGFARVSKSEQQKWGKMIEGYFSASENISLIIQLVDIRHCPTEEDKQMLEWIQYYKYPVIIVANKSDKLGKSRWHAQINQIREKLSVSKETDIIPFSSLKRDGKEVLLKSIKHHLQDHLQD